MIFNYSYRSREVWRRAQGEERVVFVHGVEDAGVFIPKFYNWNEPDWRNARRVYLVEPGLEERERWAARFGESRWRVVGFYRNDCKQRASPRSGWHADDSYCCFSLLFTGAEALILSIASIWARTLAASSAFGSCCR